MKLIHLIASMAIVACTAIAWFFLGSVLADRTRQSTSDMAAEVAGVWGPALVQKHPEAWFETPNAPGGRAMLPPSSSKITVDLKSEPKRRGLVWHRTYRVDFKAEYVFTNPTRIPQTVYVSFPLPDHSAGLNGFRFLLDGVSPAEQMPASSGGMTRAVVVPALGSVTLHTGYGTRGSDSFSYVFPDNRRVAGFDLVMKTDFGEINFPVGTGSPGERAGSGGGWELRWNYPDVLGAPSIGMDMPNLLNAGPVAARIAFFAPVSLLLFVVVMLLMATLKGVPLHPVHVFFVSAGFFAFHLLFAYLVDLVPLAPAFGIATVVSVVLVCGYLKAVGGRALFRIALPAQLGYLVLFSLSFFFDGLTGITLTVCSVLTLALLMALTAKVDWRAFEKARTA
ncbi:inner membrane CreD family protein [Luteolibacter sp. SL250]|uniref:inner membrane CreD family protein n=1 Tax=Luteolibacter sp. SL250 TaxID=2995170 RepID=UPI00226D5699|nr:inner membrane CreD family protein [Luteolibacter sp. SL250]WAC20718.1 inner membrane CreD family protein [Luteolibacter sp. SL250]